MSKTRKLLEATILLTAFSFGAPADYLLMQGDPKEGEYPLNTVLQVKFQQDVATVKDAFVFLLHNTAYRFRPPPETDPASVAMIQPIEKRFREMGPMPLYRILSKLVGVDFQVVLNPATKEITVSRQRLPLKK